VISVVHLVDAAGNHLWGKAWVIFWLMESQRASGLIDPKLVTFAPGRLNTLAAERGFFSRSLDSSHHRLPLMAITTLKSLLQECAHPVLHTHGYKPNIVGRLLRLMGRPASAVISTCHGWVEDSLALKFYNAFDRRTSFLSDRLVLPDENMVARLPAYTNASVIPNGVPTRCVPSAEERRNARRKFGWQDDQFVVGMLTRITKAKGVSDFQEAISLAGNREIVWAVAGAEPDVGPHLSRKPSPAQFVGYVAPPRDYLAALDIFVQASHSEGLSLALLEAARSALPIVATKVGATECALRHGKEALLVPARDPKSLADSIMMLYHDRYRARQLGTAARRRFEECYQIERMNEAYLRLYRTVLAKGNGNVAVI
jgi:glycosyltransferase involved in cell wall biosynthesis